MSHGIRGSQLADLLLRLFRTFSATPEGRAACSGAEPCSCQGMQPTAAARKDVPAPPSTVEKMKEPAPSKQSKADNLDKHLRPMPINETK